MSVKINKNGNEYPVGVIPENYIRKVDELYTPRKIAEASANQSYSAQLTSLQSAFNSLTDSQKLRSFIKFHDGYIARYSNVGYDLHTNFEVSSTTFNATQINIPYSNIRTYNGSTFYDLSGTTDASPMELWV